MKPILTVHPPIPKKQLGRYRGQKGTYLVRHKDVVIYIGNSKNIYKAVLRLFQKHGVLHHLDIRRVIFEVVFSTLRRPSITDVLKGEFMPTYNYKGRLLKLYSDYEEKQAERIRTHYYEQTGFDSPQKKINGQQ